ncbi:MULTISPECIES: hypothetical protein [Peptoniphilus]|uniref:Transposase n=1 Tax=Peptoniphilus porci TaxID=2652280 RepID=A0A1U7LZ57_9FIRM|nr:MULTISPECIES: hypothetical protein [Peptoniphilus]OLR64711.1 hypothetical protein BIV18_03735 [Peptoniphilus porci]
MSIRTEEMRFRQILCEYALKHGVTKAARRYHTNRQFVYRQLKNTDEKIIYGREVFTSEKQLKKEIKEHEIKYNSTAKYVLNFKSPNEIIK